MTYKCDILFDIGKVLLDFDFAPAMSGIIPKNHPDPEAAFQSILAKKDSFERGEISIEDYTLWALETLKTDLPPKEFHAAWVSIFTENSPMWHCAHDSKKAGHRLILFSNINALHFPFVQKEYPDFSLFDEAVLSYQVGYIKPEKDIYQYAIAKYKLNPSHTLYIDDMPENIAAGKEIGFRSFQYDIHSHPQFITWLNQEISSLPQ